MKVDEFLKKQEQAAGRVRATLQSVEPGKVKITPVVDGGCGCSRSVVLDASKVSEVHPTGQRHLCCGRMLEIVELDFAADAAIPVRDLLMPARVSTTVSNDRELGDDDATSRRIYSEVRGRRRAFDDTVYPRGTGFCKGLCEERAAKCFKFCGQMRGAARDNCIEMICMKHYDDCMLLCEYIGEGEVG